MKRLPCGLAEWHRWPAMLRRMVCIGSPHHGSPLERRGNLVDVLLGISPYSAPLARLGQIRSAGVTDLRFGNVRDDDRNNRARFAWSRDLAVVLLFPMASRASLLQARSRAPWPRSFSVTGWSPSTAH